MSNKSHRLTVSLSLALICLSTSVLQAAPAPASDGAFLEALSTEAPCRTQIDVSGALKVCYPPLSTGSSTPAFRATTAAPPPAAGRSRERLVTPASTCRVDVLRTTVSAQGTSTAPHAPAIQSASFPVERTTSFTSRAAAAFRRCRGARGVIIRRTTARHGHLATRFAHRRMPLIFDDAAYTRRAKR